MVYTAIYSKNVLTYVALFHNDLCFTANHCIIRLILWVSSMGLHPGWIPLPNITSQWSVLYGNPLKCKSNFRSLLHRISSRIYPGWIPHHHYNFKAAHCVVHSICLTRDGLQGTTLATSWIWKKIKGQTSIFSKN